MERDELYAKLRAAEDLGQPALAIELGSIYLTRHPSDWGALMYYGMALQSVARYEEASAAFARALEISDENARRLVYRQLGTLAQARTDLAAAESWFKQAIDARPDDATGYIYLGSLLAKAGRFTDAEAIHRKAVACADECLDEAWLNLGYVLRAQGRYLDALECFRNALTLDPECTDAHAALADVEQVLFHFPEA